MWSIENSGMRRPAAAENGMEDTGTPPSPTDVPGRILGDSRMLLPCGIKGPPRGEGVRHVEDR
jgi:hypothetical protein